MLRGRGIAAAVTALGLLVLSRWAHSEELVLHLPLTEGEGLVARSTVGGLAGRFSGSETEPTPVWLGGVASFDGPDRILLLPLASSLRLAGAFTMSAWVYPRRYCAPKEDKACIVTMRSAYYFQLRPNGKLNGGFYHDTGDPLKRHAYVELASARSVPLDRWSFVAFSYDGRAMRLYVAGEQVAERALAQGRVMENDSRVTIGYEHGFGRPYTGLLSHVRVYREALSREQIVRDMSAWQPPEIEAASLPALAGGAKAMPVRRYVDDKPVPAATDQERARGFLAFGRPYVDLVFENAVPLASERFGKLDLRMARGEYEPATFATRALRDLAGVRVSVKGGTLPAGWVDVRLARPMVKRFHAKFTEFGRTGDAGTKGEYELMRVPTWLAKTKGVDLAEDTSAWWWLTIHADEEAAPGTYSGTVTIEQEGTPAAAVAEIEVTVLPFDLEEAAGYNFGFYDPSHNEQYWTIADRFADQRAHGMTSVGWHGRAGLKLSLADGRVRVDFQGSAVAHVMDAYRDAGFPEPLLWLMRDDIYRWCTEEADGDERKAGTLFTQVIRAIENERRVRGWPEIIYQPQDEVIGHPKRMKEARHKIKWLKEAGVRTEMDHFCTGPSGERKAYVEELLPFTDVITNRFTTRPIWYPLGWDEMVEWAGDNGKILWTYNITDAKTFPSPTTLRFTHGWFFRTFGRTCTGIYLWQYAGVHGDPYNESDPERNRGEKFDDMTYRIPADPGRGYSGGPTIEYECMREGIDDLRYIITLERAIEEGRLSDVAEARELARKHGAMLEGLVQRFNFDLLASRSQWVESHFDTLETLADGTRVARGKFVIPTGFGIGDYDRAREAMIEGILEIKTAMGVSVGE